jgi:hypothetical protein
VGESHSQEFTAYQIAWPDLILTSYSDSGCIVSFRPDTSRSFRPNLVIIRSLARTIAPQGGSSDHRNIQYEVCYRPLMYIVLAAIDSLSFPNIVIHHSTR